MNDTKNILIECAGWTLFLILILVLLGALIKNARNNIKDCELLGGDYVEIYRSSDICIVDGLIKRSYK